MKNVKRKKKNSHLWCVARSCLCLSIYLILLILLFEFLRYFQWFLRATHITCSQNVTHLPHSPPLFGCGRDFSAHCRGKKPSKAAKRTFNLNSGARADWGIIHGISIRFSRQLCTICKCARPTNATWAFECNRLITAHGTWTSHTAIFLYKTSKRTSNDRWMRDSRKYEKIK